MRADDLLFSNLSNGTLKDFRKRSSDVSGQFLRWFLESIFRLDSQDADDAAVDAKQDKGIDGVYVNDITETIFLIQVKTKQNPNSSLGDTELKEFYGSIQQFKTAASIQTILDGTANDKLKATLRRSKFIEKVDGGFSVIGIFCTNVVANKDAFDYLKTISDIELYDANRICSSYVEDSISGGIDEVFKFDLSDTGVIKYDTSDNVSARIFLADALQLLHLKGITDGTLFERNVRLSLGNTKVNKAVIESIRNKSEHRNFPLYHNGINILCEEITLETDDEINIRNYVVVNGAQSLTSLNSTKSKISDDLRILVKVVQVRGDNQLSEKITTNSNNQNAIKARDLRSNHAIQRRLQIEIAKLNYENIVYEIKQGERNIGKTILSNEDAGLALLALDVGEPWNCHQKYKIMEDSHSEIFGRPDVTGWKVIALYKALKSVENALDGIQNQSFANYTLTKYVLASAVAEIIKGSPIGKSCFSNFEKIYKSNKLDDFINVFSQIASTTAMDLNAEVEDELSNGTFDYKSELKSQKWVRGMRDKLKASYSKDVKRQRASSVDSLLGNIL